MLTQMHDMCHRVKELKGMYINESQPAESRWAHTSS